MRPSERQAFPMSLAHTGFGARSNFSLLGLFAVAAVDMAAFMGGRAQAEQACYA